LRAAASLARLRRDQGRRAEARDLLAPVYSWFTEGFDTPDLREAKALMSCCEPVIAELTYRFSRCGNRQLHDHILLSASCLPDHALAR
jgi:hypothetical protein